MRTASPSHPIARRRTGSIVQVTLWNSPYLGNFMSSQLLLAQAVREQLGMGTHFVLADGALAYDWVKTIDAEGFSSSVLPSKQSLWRKHLDAAVRKHDARLMHTHFTAADIPAALAARSAGIPCVWHVRTGFNGYPIRQRAKDLLKMRIVARRHVAHIVAVSDWLAELLKARGAPTSRIEVLPNPIVTERFQALPEHGAARERFRLSQDAEVVLALGWWPDVKGVDVLLDAIEELSNDHPALQVLVVGEDQLRDYLRRRWASPPSWLRVSGFVDDSAWLFAAADAFVSASRHEGQSSAVGEALACGLPVIMSDIPGTRYWQASPNVQVFPSEAASLLATELRSLLARPLAARKSDGEAAKGWVLSHAGAARWCTHLCELYASLIDREPASPEAARSRA